VRRQRIITISFMCLTWLAMPGDGIAQTVLWNESVSGDLSNNQAAPNAFTLPIGVSSIIGNVTGGTDPQDWVALTVPPGTAMTSLVLASYTSTDVQGFTGFQLGGSFVGSVNTAGSYTGYTHYGTGAANNGHAATNLVGQNLLPIMADLTQDPGATGFTPPLGPGTYSFLIQQLGASTGYEFDYTVAPVPEPGSLLLSGLAGVVAFSRWLRRKGRPAGRQ
jgi:hypothetical protein